MWTKLFENCFFCVSNRMINRVGSCFAEIESHSQDVNVFVLKNIYYSWICKMLRSTFGFILDLLLSDLRFIIRPYVIKEQESQVFLQALRNVANNKKSNYEDENNFTDDEFQCIAPITKPQFSRIVYTYCDSSYLFVTGAHSRNTIDCVFLEF